jgi:hypothetical protein
MLRNGEIIKSRMIDDEGLEGKNPVLIDLNAKNLDF